MDWNFVKIANVYLGDYEENYRGNVQCGLYSLCEANYSSWKRLQEKRTQSWNDERLILPEHLVCASIASYLHINGD